MPSRRKTLSALDAALIAFDNEVEASRRALQSMCEHVRRIEEELAVERVARQLSEQRQMILECELRARDAPPPATSGVRVRARKV